ncbi:MAG: hypothetical protein JSR61_05675 [Proteobacteria bacterium]|nr:hypothetical protein [Pseudomonadota bacterium]
MTKIGMTRVTRRNFAKRTATLFFVPALTLLVTACASNNPQEDKLGTFLVAPGKYVLYDCQQLQATASNFRERRDTLRKAMADAEKAPAGGLVSLLAYRGEYGQIEGNLAEIRREAASKNCVLKAATPPAAAAPPPPKPAKRRSR